MPFNVNIPDNFFFELSEHLQGFVTDDVTYFVAQLGNGVGPDAYAEIPLIMRKKPADLKGAYEQAYFYTALAAQRAIRLEDEHKIPFGSARIFFSQLIVLADQLVIASSGAGPACENMGIGCGMKTGPQVLRDTIELIRTSALPDSDKTALTGFVRHNRNALVLTQLLPWVAILGVGGLIVSGIGYRRRAQPEITIMGDVETVETK